MGKLNFTSVQKIVFDEFSKEKELTEKFYFTGGTALSVFHLHHRYSEDLDFFTKNTINDEEINQFMEKISSILKINYRFTKVVETRMFEFEKKGKLIIKVDFGYYPHTRLEAGKEYHGVSIDSLLDIGANKLITITQRYDAKDYVDLYFLLKKFTVWDLIYAVEKKFRRETDIVFLSSDFLSTEDFDYMPKMIKPLALNELKKFFRDEAKKLGRRVTI